MSPSDPAPPLALTGRVERFLIDIRGEADGLLLADGTEVRFPAAAARIADAVKPGQDVRVHGHWAADGAMFAATSVETEAGGHVSLENPAPSSPSDDPGPPAEGREPVEVAGVVRQALHGPEGEPNGALLEDGRIVHIQPRAAPLPEGIIEPGRELAATGESLTNALGVVVDATAFNVSLSPESDPPDPAASASARNDSPPKEQP